MMNVKKYQKQYYMPPVPCMDWAKKDSIDYAVDIYPFYGSDADAALSAGKDARHGLIGAGVYASHGYERSHKDGVVNTFRLLCSYLNGNAPKMD